jgi:hypothetical protein
MLSFYFRGVWSRSHCHAVFAAKIKQELKRSGENTSISPDLLFDL